MFEIENLDAEGRKLYAFTRKQYQLDSGSVDDVVEKLQGREEKFTDNHGHLFVSLECPFQDDFDCEYELIEKWSEDDEEFLMINVAAHMLTQHLPLEE